MKTVEANGSSHIQRGKKSKAANVAVAFLTLYVLAISSGMGIAKFHSASLPPLVRDAIQSHTPTLGLAAALGVAGIFGLAIWQRRRPPKKAAPIVVRSRPILFEKPTENVHPLFTTPRTVRDNSFIFKKTRKKGRVYRNREGEKVLHEPE